MNTKLQYSDDSKSDYALELQKANQAQREHYETVMPQIFQVCLTSSLRPFAFISPTCFLCCPEVLFLPLNISWKCLEIVGVRFFLGQVALLPNLLYVFKVKAE